MLQHPTNYWHLFLSPMLHCCYQESIHTDFISHCAALGHLLIESFDQDIADKLSSLSDSVCSCKRLVTLTGPPLDLAAWEHLSNLHTLVGVVIGKTGRRISSPKLDLNNHNLNFAPFLNLATLYFCSDTAVYITMLMQHSEFPSLKEFSMDVDALPWMEAERLFCALSQCKAYQTLETIFIACSGPEVHEPSGNSLTAVTHLLCFTQLRYLYLGLHCSIVIDNNLLFEAMSKWPHICSLELVDWQITPVTFRGLLAALRQCPHLHSLQISMDIVNIDIDPETESFRHTALQQLTLTRSDLADGEAVARIVFSVLPYVNSVLYSEFLRSYSWDEVNRHLQSFQSSLVTGPDIAGAPSEI
ncbi:hypothetical protein F4604DRAFT_1925623 [Suillus subluteus]|nr:hypothetical protein F4604DRAFT_1925623 [Suillus subluteus]